MKKQEIDQSLSESSVGFNFKLRDPPRFYRSCGDKSGDEGSDAARYSCMKFRRICVKNYYSLLFY